LKYVIVYIAMKLKKDKKLHIRRLEKIEIINAFKVMGNEYRLNMLLALKKFPHISLDQVNKHVGGDIKNISMHMQKIHNAGLVFKKYEGRFVKHSLTEYGKRAIQSFQLFERDLDL